MTLIVTVLDAYIAPSGLLSDTVSVQTYWRGPGPKRSIAPAPTEMLPTPAFDVTSKGKFATNVVGTSVYVRADWKLSLVPVTKEINVPAGESSGTDSAYEPIRGGR